MVLFQKINKLLINKIKKIKLIFCLEEILNEKINEENKKQVCKIIKTPDELLLI